MINTSIFKSYDIRGIYPAELNEEVAFKIGRVFVEYTKAKKIAIGQDGRLSSPAIFQALSKGIIEQGADVYNIGQIPTECLYFSTGFYDIDAGIMITASHNPREYNGFKMVKKENNEIKVIRGKDMARLVGGNNFSKSTKKGEIKTLEVRQDYLNHILSLVDLKKMRPLKIVFDAGNGVAGKILSLLLPSLHLPIKTISLNFDVDGNFPVRPPNPLLPGASQQIKKAILLQKADFGFMFDGDADRIFLIDEKGEMVKADIVLLFLAKYFLGKYPSSAIAYNLICSKAVPEFIKKWGGNPIKTAVGFVNVREGLIKNNGVMGGELSGHYCFRDNFYLDSGFIAFLTLLKIISGSDKKVSETAVDLSPYAKESEINFEIKDKEAILNKVKEKYSNGHQDYLDGITIEYDDWWFNVRSSQTEPFLRLTIEAKTTGLLEEKKKELVALISNT